MVTKWMVTKLMEIIWLSYHGDISMVTRYGYMMLYGY